MSDKSKFLQGVVFNYLNAPITVMVSLCQSAFALRFLEPNIASICLFLIGLSSFISICDFGVSTILAREMSFIEHNEKKSIRKSLFINAAISINRRLSLSLLLIGGILLLIYLHYLLPVVDQVLLLSNAGLFIIGFAFRLLSNPHAALLSGLKRVDLQRIANIVSSLIGLVYLILMLFVFVKTSFYAFSSAILVQYASLFFISQGLTKRLFWTQHNFFSKRHSRFLFSAGLKVFLITLGAYLIFQVNPPVIAYYLGPRQLITFMPIFQALTSAMTVCFLMQTAYMPFIASMFSQHGFEAIHSSAIAFLKFNMALIILVVVCLSFCGDELFQLWLGHGYQVDKTLLLLLSIMIVLETQHVTLATIVINCGYIAFIQSALWAGVLNIILLMLFLPKLGIEGTGLSILLAQLCTNNWYVVYKSIKIMHLPGRVFLSYLTRIVLYFLLLSFFAAGIVQFIHISSLRADLLLKISLMLTAGILFAYLTLLSKPERDRIFSYLDRRGQA